MSRPPANIAIHDLQRLRVDLRLTAVGLAKGSSVARSTIVKLEAGGRVEKVTALKVLHYLNSLCINEKIDKESEVRKIISDQILNLSGNIEEKESSSEISVNKIMNNINEFVNRGGISSLSYSKRIEFCELLYEIADEIKRYGRNLDK